MINASRILKFRPGNWARLELGKCILSFFLLLFIVQLSFGQGIQKTPRFWEHVQTIKKYDQLFKPLPSPILFVGSSSVRRWDNLNVVFGHYNVLNRGIGGSVVNDILFYLDDIVFPYSPRQIVLYVGGNDFGNKTATADTVFTRMVNLYRVIKAKLPDVPIAYISVQSTPSTEDRVDRVIAFNQMMKDFLAKEANASFIDVFNQLRKNGKNRPELFVEDRLHLNRDGYAIWEETIAPYLIKPVTK